MQGALPWLCQADILFSARGVGGSERSPPPDPMQGLTPPTQGPAAAARGHVAAKIRMDKNARAKYGLVQTPLLRRRNESL